MDETRRIKLIVSDFHLGTGKRNPNGSLNLMEDFVFDERFIEFLEHYSTGNYTNAEVELIINGDFLNLLQVPVDGAVTVNITESIACRQLQKIFDGHPLIFDALASFCEREDKFISMNIGNHDSGLIWPSAKNMLKDRIGHELIIRNRSYEFEGVHVEHCDKYEPVHEVNPKLPYLSKNLPEPILNLPWGSYFFINFVRRRKRERGYIDKVKPFRNYFIWGVIYDFRFFIATMARLVLFTIASIAIRGVGGRRYGLSLIGMLLRQSGGNPEKRAAQELLRRSDIHTVIFGHTHVPLYRQWQAGKEYFNTGCWNGITNLDIEGFGYQEKPVYAFVQWRNGRWVTSLRLWKGTSRVSKPFWA